MKIHIIGFGKCFKDADNIYVLDIPKRVYTYRMIKRAIKRKLGLEKGKKSPLRKIRGSYYWERLRFIWLS